MKRIARLWMVGALVAALMAMGAGVASAGLTGSVGALAEDPLGQGDPQSSGSGGDEDDDGDDQGDDDDGDDDDGGGGGGQDRAFCAPAGAPDPAQCSTGTVSFDFDATSGPLGENPMGSAHFDFGGGTFIAFDVTCLVVTGNRASIGGPVTGGAPPVGSWAAFTVLDNSPATPGPDLISAVATLRVLPPNTPNCGADTAGPPTFPVDGDIVVEDNIGAGGGGEDDDDGDDDGGDD